MKIMLRFVFLLLLAGITLSANAQQVRYAELSVSDTVTLPVQKIIYQIVLGQEMNFMGMKIPQPTMEAEEQESLPSLKEVESVLKKGNFVYTIATRNYSVSPNVTPQKIEVTVANENELKTLVSAIQPIEGITGDIKKIHYQSFSAYQQESYKRLYAKAKSRAEMLAALSGDTVGALLSVSEVTGSSEMEDYMSAYSEMMKKMPFDFGLNDSPSGKEQIVNMIFKFELKSKL